MIRSFGNKITEQIWNGNRSGKIPHEIQHVARRKLRMINNAQNINDLRIPPSNHLEKLRSNYKGYYSIRINIKWRIIFKWKSVDAFEVQIIDYH